MEEKELERIRKEILICQKCSLFKTRRNPVVGEGNPKASIMFIGEAPGLSEDRTGRPFCGPAGKILDEMLESIGIKRKEVFIGNLLKCRPPANRDPRKEEIEACSPFLNSQIEIIKPKIICPLGRFSTKFIFEKYGLKRKLRQLSEISGKIFEIETLFGSVKIIPFYHPAVAIYNPKMSDILKKDFKILKKFYL